MNNHLELYRNLLGKGPIEELTQVGELLNGARILHINSTKEGGGVAEILTKMVPLTNALGIQTKWETIKGNPEFFECTKLFHNLLQGKRDSLPPHLFEVYEKTTDENVEKLRPLIDDADIVLIHDPQPLGLIGRFPQRKAKWIWRCHIDLSYPNRMLWKYLRGYVEKFDASIFSLEDFIQPLPHPLFLITPSIDPLSEKNVDMDEDEVKEVCKRYEVDLERPTIVQISRFDRFKDPVGVIRAYRQAKSFYPSLQLVLAGGGSIDDPEAKAVYDDVMLEVKGDKDIRVLLMPPAPREINALQRRADIVLQKSIREGFGLTVTEALWKMKPVIGGNAGGIRLQVINHHTGYLVNTPEGAAGRIRHLLQHPQLCTEIGTKGKKFVKENFLITKQLREYLTVMVALLTSVEDRLDLTERKVSVNNTQVQQA